MKPMLLLHGTIWGLLATVVWGGPAAAPDGHLDAGLPVVRALIERYEADRDSLQHVWGVPGAAGWLPRHRRFLREWVDRLEAVDFDHLSPAERIDWILFREELRFARHELARRQQRLEEMAELLPFDRDLATVELERRRLRFIQGREAADRLYRVTEQIKETRQTREKQLESGEDSEPVCPRTLAWRAVDRIGQLRGYLRAWRRFYEGYAPQFTWWVPQPAEAVDHALKEYADWIREKLAGVAPGEKDPVIGDPIGREALLDALRHEFIVYSPEELIGIAEREFAWCEQQARQVVQELGFEDDWRRALEHVKSLYVPPGRQPALIKAEAREAIRFVEERDLLTIPPLAKECWRMEMMSPEQQRVNPYFTGGRTINVSYPTASMAHEDKLMSLHGNNRHFCHAVVHHELIPGHHLQLFMAERYQPHRRLFRTPFLVEGWPLYWEMRLWDLGFACNPEDKVGMLFWRMHRCARIIFSLKFHLGEMTAQEAIDFLVERVGHERNNATAEVRRSVGGAYGPLYQAAYMLGGLQLRALHDELVREGGMTERAFHDAVLRQNAIPVELIRAALRGERLDRNFQASWRFYPALTAPAVQ